MTLKEKFRNAEERYFEEALVETNIKISDEFAANFALWKEVNASQDINGDYYGESRIGVSRENPVDIHQLLEIYKIKKGL